MRTRTQNKFIPIVTVDGEVIGKSTTNECHSGTFLLHPVFHLYVFNPKGELYLRKQIADKDALWSSSVASHVEYGDEVLDSLLKTGKEELDIIESFPIFAFKYTSLTDSEYELVHTYCSIYHGIITPAKNDDLEGKFWKINEIEANLGNNIFTPTFEQEFKQLIDFVR